MKELTTQEIVQQDPGVQKSGQDWRKIYYVMAKSIEADTHRIVRVANTLFWVRLLPNNEVTFTVLSADPREAMRENMLEFAKALQAAELTISEEQ
jgi:hypothetical protein